MNGSIIDNRGGNKFHNAFTRYCESTKDLDVAVGYFYVSGFDSVKESLEKINHIRLVMGTETDFDTAKQIGEGYKDRVKQQLAIDIETMTDTKKIAALGSLHNLIKSGCMDVRLYTKSRLHAKAYIFKRRDVDSDVAIIGSSNFSRRGLGIEAGGNTELNSRHTDTDAVKHISQWYENIWVEAEPYSNDLLKIIEISAPFIQTRDGDTEFVSPLALFKTMVYEYLGDDGPKPPEQILTTFQQIGFINAKNKIAKYRGCMISDSVGLGKTYVGLALIQDAQKTGQKTLLIIPSRLQDNWKTEMATNFSSIDTRHLCIMTIEEVSRLDLRNDNDVRRASEIQKTYDFLVIDEAHRFRNYGYFSKENKRYTGRKRYANLNALKGVNTRCVLLTATPLNNSMRDLDNLIRIFTDETTLRNQNSNLRLESLKDYHKTDVKLRGIRNSGIDHNAEVDLEHHLDHLKITIARVLEQVMILRTRTDIANKYGNVMIGGKRILAEQPSVTKIKYDAGKKYRLMYQDVAEMLGELLLPHMSLGSNATTAVNVSNLFKIHLFKRLESSIAAFVVSMNNFINKYERFKATLPTNGWKAALDDISAVTDTEYDADLADYVDGLESDACDTRYKKDNEVMAMINHDLEYAKNFMNKHLLGLETDTGQYIDPKIEKLVETILQHRNNKILVFSQYVDTVQYLYTTLTVRVGTGGGGEKTKIDCITGDQSRKIGSEFTPAEKIGRFAPRANHRRLKPGENIDIMLVTDALAEGINLQDCSIVINYDLPWNPMRIVQRVGRVDRIGSTEQTRVYNILTDEDLEPFLRLLATLSHKIRNISSVVGTDSPILTEDEIVNPLTIGETVQKIRTADSFETYERGGRGIFENPLGGDEHGEMIMNIQQAVDAHNVTGFTKPKKIPVYTIATGSRKEVFVMFRIHTKNTIPLNPVIKIKDLDSGSISTVRIDHPSILELPQCEIVGPKQRVKTICFDKEVSEIVQHFDKTDFAQIKDSYKMTRMILSEPVQPMQANVTDKLQDIYIKSQDELDGPISDQVVKDAGMMLVHFRAHPLLQDHINALKHWYGPGGMALIRRMRAADFVDKTVQFYDTYLRDHPLYEHILEPADVKYTIVCKGAFV